MVLGVHYVGYIGKTYKINENDFFDHCSFTYTFYKDKEAFLKNTSFIALTVLEDKTTRYKIIDIFESTQQQNKMLRQPKMLVAQVEISGYRWYTFFDMKRLINQIRDGVLIPADEVKEVSREDRTGMIQGYDGQWRWF